MFKRILLLLVTLIVGIAIGAFAMLYAFPFLFPPPVAKEQICNIASKKVVAKGTFIHPNPSDPVHWGQGNMLVYANGKKQEIFLKDNFKVGPGPDYYVYLSKSSDIKTRAAFRESKKLEIARLRSFEGSQVYALPAGTNLKDYQSVVVWCKRFGQLITTAKLK